MSGIIYEVAWRSGFFGEYNRLAANGRARRGLKPDRDDSELDFLSMPTTWARDVVADICKSLKGRQRLDAVGEFLAAAQFYGLNTNGLAQEYLSLIARKYVGVDRILALIPEAAKQKSLEEILQDPAVSQITVIFTTPEGKDAYYVPRNKIRSFARTVFGREIDVRQVRVLEAWHSLTNGAKARPNEYNKESEGANNGAAEFRLPENQLDFHSYELGELLGDKLKKERERRAAYTGLINALSQVYHKKRLEAEREDPIQSEPGRTIRDLIRGIPPSSRRSETLSMISAAATQYIAMARQNHDGLRLTAEVEALAGVWEKASTGAANDYARKVLRVMRELQGTVQGYSR